MPLRLAAALTLALGLSTTAAVGQDLSDESREAWQAAEAAQAEPDLPSWLGLGVQEAFERLGAPAELYSLRGEEPWQDDVVFRYPGGFYLFWYQGRVWQVRLDIRHAGEVFRIRMGASREQVRATLGPPWREEAAALVYHLEDRGYPVRLRFYFEHDLLVDLYCYRGDL